MKRRRLIKCVLVLTVGLWALVGTAATRHDADRDGMCDEYEMLFGLDRASAADAALNYDADSLTNGAEAALGTDPWVADTDRDGFNDGADSNALSRVYIKWGHPFFTSSNSYDYAGCSWWTAAYKIAGEWQTNEPTAWHVPASESEDVGRLVIEVDRAILTNDLVMGMDFYDHTDASLYVDLEDTNAVVVVTNLFNNLIAENNIAVHTNLTIPLESHPDAAAIVMRRGHGEITVYTNLLYIDKDRDGLDADQEAQLGTSDGAADSDGDGLSDFSEVFTHHTDPAKADTDNDGMPDGWETQHGLNPLMNDGASDTDGDGVSNFVEYQQGRDPAAGATLDSSGILALKVYTPME
jgi:hypothetical protein